ncbi:hypothetical protein [Pseudomonas phage vB_PA32_GUMS]|nr:hypothetical protein [Pseudomonas phage vB_PA32_GUMS]
MMGLRYMGYSVKATVTDREGESHIFDGFAKPGEGNSVYPGANGEGDKRLAARRALEAFMDSPVFEELTSDMYDTFDVRFNSLVHTGMPE